MAQNPNSSSKFDRKTREKTRRNEMNSLYTELSSLVPHESSKEICSVADHLEGATKYIKQLQTNLESMKQKKEMLMMMVESGNFRSSFCRDSSSSLKLPRMDIDFCGSTLDVVLITGLNYEFLFTHTLRILQEEGADVVSASSSVVDQSVFHTLHSKIGGRGLEYDVARLSERLRKLVINDDRMTNF